MELISISQHTAVDQTCVQDGFFRRNFSNDNPMKFGNIIIMNINVNGFACDWACAMEKWTEIIFFCFAVGFFFLLTPSNGDCSFHMKSCELESKTSHETRRMNWILFNQNMHWHTNHYSSSFVIILRHCSSSQNFRYENDVYMCLTAKFLVRNWNKSNFLIVYILEKTCYSRKSGIWLSAARIWMVQSWIIFGLYGLYAVADE